MLRSADVSVDAAKRLVSEVTEIAASQSGVLQLKQKLVTTGLDASATGLERYLLIQCALDSLKRLPAEAVSDEVKHLLCREYTQYTQPKPNRAREFRAGQNPFQASCKIATLRRFPAGQFDWEISGIPRSWFLKLRGEDIVRLPAYLLFRLGGRGPVFFRHFGVRRPMILLETAADASYRRMAESLRLQPEIRGMVGCGWLSSPDTHRASPHLAWANRKLES